MDTVIEVRLPPATLEALDRYLASRPNLKQEREDVIREALEVFLVWTRDIKPS